MQSKILIIEDDHAITHLLDVALTLDYYNVTTADNATQAHFKIQIDKPDVILLDLVYQIKMIMFDFRNQATY